MIGSGFPLSGHVNTKGAVAKRSIELKSVWIVLS